MRPDQRAGHPRCRPHAIAVVRETLLDEARRRFEPRWGKATVIGPDDAARKLVLETTRAAGGAH